MTYSALFKVWATVLAAVLAAILLTTAAFHDRRQGASALLLGEGGPGCRPRRTRLGGGKARALGLITEKEQTLDVAKKVKDLLALTAARCT